MSIDEELQEHAEHAKEPFDKMVAVTMAIIAAIIAVVGVMAHIYTTEELLNQQKASDQWAFYQAKSIRRYVSTVAKDMSTNAKNEDAVKKYEANEARYEKEGEEIQEKAKEFEAESHLAGEKAHRLDKAEVFLELGIVLASLAILAKARIAWFTSMASAAVGVVLSLSVLLVK